MFAWLVKHIAFSYYYKLIVQFCFYMPHVSATSFKADFPTLKQFSLQVISITYYEFTLWGFSFFFFVCGADN